MNKVNCIMLIDDNPDDNFFHERIIRKSNAAEKVLIKESGYDALDYLKSKENLNDCHPNIILLDINMPGMNGWEFIDEYKKLDENVKKSLIVVMLTTSDNPDDIEKAKITGALSDYKSKPLTKEMLEEILSTYEKDFLK